MKRSGSQFAAAVKVIAERDFRSQESHPSREELRQFAENRLEDGSEPRERIEDHLALCRECADWVLEKRLQSRTSGRIVSILASPKLAYSVAAVLAAALFLALWIPRPPQPHGNLHLFTLTPFEERSDGAQRGVPGDSDFEPLPVPAQADSVVLILSFAGNGDFDGYSAEVFDLSRSGEHRLLWSTTDLKRMPEGHFTLEIPSKDLQPGRYTVRVHGVQARDWQQLAEYLAQVPE